MVDLPHVDAVRGGLHREPEHGAVQTLHAPFLFLGFPLDDKVVFVVVLGRGDGLVDRRGDGRRWAPESVVLLGKEGWILVLYIQG